MREDPGSSPRRGPDLGPAWAGRATGVVGAEELRAGAAGLRASVEVAYLRGGAGAGQAWRRRPAMVAAAGGRWRCRSPACGVPLLEVGCWLGESRSALLLLRSGMLQGAWKPGQRPREDGLFGSAVVAARGAVSAVACGGAWWSATRPHSLVRRSFRFVV